MADGKIIFQKNYTRDTSLFLQDIWARDQSIKIPKLLGSANPYLPGIVHSVVKGSVEIWENKAATGWLLDSVLNKNRSDPSFLLSNLEEHQKILVELKA